MRIKTFFGAALCVSDKVCDYVPLLSALTNTVDLAGKAVLSRKSNLTSEGNIPNADEVKEGNLYKKHLKSKSIKRCLIASVPVAGNGAVLIYDLSKGASKIVKFCMKQYKLSRASTEREATLNQDPQQKTEVKKDENSTASSDENSNDIKPNKEKPIAEKRETNEINVQGLSSHDSDTSSEESITQEPQKKAVSIGAEAPQGKRKNHATSTEEDSSSHKAETSESSKSEEASEVSESSSTEEEPIAQAEPVPSTQNLTVYFESKLNAKLTHTQTILDEIYGKGNTTTTETFTLKIGRNKPTTLVTTHYSSLEGKPCLIVRMEHFQKDNASALSLKEYLDFLETEGFIAFHHNYGITDKDFEIICRSKESTELAARMVLRLASDPRVNHLSALISSTLDGAQLQRVFFKYLVVESPDLMTILWAFTSSTNASKIITTEKNPSFKNFIEKFSEIASSSRNSFFCIHRWLTSPAIITEGARRQIYLAATNYLLKHLLGTSDAERYLVNIMKTTKINSGETPDKKLSLASTTIRLMAKEQAVFLLDRLCYCTIDDDNSEMYAGFWRNLILPLVQQVNEKIKEENDSESEEYPLPIIYLNKDGKPTEKLLFPRNNG